MHFFLDTVIHRPASSYFIHFGSWMERSIINNECLKNRHFHQFTETGRSQEKGWAHLFPINLKVSFWSKHKKLCCNVQFRSALESIRLYVLSWGVLQSRKALQRRTVFHVLKITLFCMIQSFLQPFCGWRKMADLVLDVSYICRFYSPVLLGLKLLMNSHCFPLWGYGLEKGIGFHQFRLKFAPKYWK